MSRERQEQVKVKSLSRVRLFVTPWTGAYQVPPSMEFPGKSTGVGCHFLLQGIILTQGSNPVSLIAGRHFTIWATWQEEAVPTYSGGVAGAPGRSLGQRVFRSHASLWKISFCPVFEVQKKNGSVCHCCCSTTQSCLTATPRTAARQASLSHHQLQKVKVKSLSRVRLCYPVNCSPPGSSVHWIFQARILEWVAISFSRGSSQPRDWTRSPALRADGLTSEPSGVYSNSCPLSRWCHLT